MSSTSFSSFLSSSSAASGKGSASRGLGDRIAERTGSGIPKFKSFPPPSLPISTPAGAASPSSWFAIPPGLSPAELLDSPILLSSSNIFPSPTTGTFPILGFDWKTNSDRDLKNDYKINFPEFSFQTQEKPLPSYSTGDQTWGSSYTFDDQNNNSNNQIPPKQDDTRQSPDRSNDLNSSSQSFSPEIAAIQTTNTANKRSDDGYNWRKYGQKQVKGSENPRSYYKCTYPNCPTKKKVERSLEGRITEIVYKGTHNHPKPQSTRRSSTSSSSASAASSVINHQPQSFSEIPDQSSYGNNDNSVGKMEFLAMTPENNSSISVGDEEFEQSSQKTADEIDEDEHNAKRWKGETETEGISAAGNRAVREPRVVVQTTSDIDILDDGYRWRKYGQKVVKGNPNPRSYYKCTTPGCPVRKHVERASHDPRAVITTYEGKHNHDVPAARGSGSHAISRPMASNPGANNGPAMTILPHQHDPNYPMRHSQAPGAAEPRAPNTLEMLSSSGGFGYPGFGNSCTMYPSGNENVLFGRTKDEPRDDMFLESLPC